MFFQQLFFRKLCGRFGNLIVAAKRLSRLSAIGFTKITPTPGAMGRQDLSN
jgi:hypothetical protein